MIEKAFKVLMHDEQYVNIDALHLGIFYVETPELLEMHTDEKYFIFRIKNKLQLFSKDFEDLEIDKDIANNLAVCELDTVKIVSQSLMQDLSSQIEGIKKRLNNLIEYVQ